MFNKKEKLIIILLATVSLILLFFRIGDLTEKIEQQNKAIQDTQKNINTSINNLKASLKKPNITQGEDATTELLYSFNKFDTEKNKVVTNFSVSPKEFNKNLETYLISDGQAFQLKKKDYVFKGSRAFSLNDKFINVISYVLDDVTRTDAVNPEIYDTKVGELILPKMSVSVKNFTDSIAQDTFNANLIFKLQVKDAKEQFVEKNEQKTANFNQFEINLKKNDELIYTEKFDMNLPSTLLDFHEVKLSTDFTYTDKIEIYYSLVDDFNLTHKKNILLYENMKKQSVPDVVQVFGKNPNEVLYEYK